MCVHACVSISVSMKISRWQQYLHIKRDGCIINCILSILVTDDEMICDCLCKSPTYVDLQNFGLFFKVLYLITLVCSL